MKKASSIVSVLLIMIAIILMILPIGVKQTWADPGGTYVYLYPYFSFFVFGASGNALPLLVAILTTAVFILMITRFFIPLINRKTNKIVLGSLIIAIIFSLISFLIFDTTSIAGIIITLLIILAATLHYLSEKEE